MGLEKRTNGEAAVVFEGVVKKYPGQSAVNGVDFSLPRGKLIGLIGPNGSGKSTTLKLMAGLLRPTKGRVTVNGERACRLSSNCVAYLPEQDAYYAFFTVGETIRFYAEQFADFDSAKAKQMVAFLGLERDKQTGSLSKGGRARLKIVLALSRRAPLVLLDEPLSGLDPMVRESIVRSLISFVDLPEQTVIMTTHEIAEVEPILDMVVAMRDGKVVRIDEVERIRGENGTDLVRWMKDTYGGRSHAATE